MRYHDSLVVSSHAENACRIADPILLSSYIQHHTNTLIHRYPRHTNGSGSLQESFQPLSSCDSGRDLRSVNAIYVRKADYASWMRGGYDIVAVLAESTRSARLNHRS